MHFDLTRLGASERQLEELREFLSLPAGMLIVTGPTGSGKTTLLYSILSQLDAERLNICTVEDPVEYVLPGIAQTHVNRTAGLGFGRAVRHLLRADPDVIMCGEVRDLETAEVLMQAAITGHLTLTCLHPFTAPGVLRRLVNMGVEPFLIADTVSLVCAVRLVRTICEACKQEHPLTETERTWLANIGAAGLRAYEGRGCEACAGTGYSGRTGLFELLKMTDALRERVMAHASAEEMDQALKASGHATLVDHGREKVRAGITTLQEVAAVARGL
jgi:type II secretory ATPase GspE/PulE/Tfp pilus assembly ATPase PilB-like protein